MDRLLESFKNPGAEFRGKPFWSWNGELDQAELLRQIHIFKEMGFGGFFMHSRTGLITEYLGDEWFHLTNVCADESVKQGMEAWLYDEDRWPSGTAGGLVTQDASHRQKFVSLQFVKPAEFSWDTGILAAFTADLDGIAFTHCRRLIPGQMPEISEGLTILVFRIEAPESSSFYNGYTYVDTLSHQATEVFLDLTHERYKEHCGDRLGKSILGIFTDEPHRGPVMCGFSISNANRLWMTPWTDRLLAEFQSAFGYDLVDRLPELFLQPDHRAVSSVKWHYMELLQRLFLRNFAKPMLDWCRQNKMLLTGHVLHEDSLTAQSCMQGSLMRFYEFMDYPGIDILTEGNRCYWVVKQLSSAARQLGQRWLLSELYGCTGWQMNFESHKAVGDWQALFGINVRCQHLSWYTMEGEAKRDYPASISHQSAWWKDYAYVEDYFSRLGVILSQGKPWCDLLVINPVESVWCQIHGGWSHSLSPQSPGVRALEKAYTELFHWLAGAQLDFDYGDEEMMSRLASVQTDVEGAPVLKVGQAEYRGVVVGGMLTIRSSTVELLQQFAKAGGAVIVADDPPRYVDAVPSAGEISNAQRVAWEGPALVEACRKAIGEQVEIVDADDKSIPHVFCQLRRDESGRRYLVAINVDPRQPVPMAKIRLKRAQAEVAEWDCETAKRYLVNVKSGPEGSVEFETDFPPSGSRAFVMGEGVTTGLKPRTVIRERSRQRIVGPFAYRLSEPNVCVLDVARYQVDAGPWHGAAEVLKIDQAVRGEFGLKIRSGEMVQPWFRRRTEPQAPVRGTVRLVFEFDVTEIPSSPIELAMEHPEQFGVQINGAAIGSSLPRGYWIDRAIRRIAIPAGALKLGANELRLEVAFHEGVNLEAVYLLGAFGVTLAGTRAMLGALPSVLQPDDVTAQFLPFYGGEIHYLLPTNGLRKSARMLLELPAFEAACVRVSAPGKEPLMIAWQPYRVDVTELAQDAQTLTLEVVLTRRNSFGPLHQIPLRAGAYGPGNFTTTGANWSDEYMLYPAGLLKPPVLIEA